jgi:hypothetical protein
MFANVSLFSGQQHDCTQPAWLSSITSWCAFLTWTPSQRSRWACVYVHKCNWIIDWAELWTCAVLQMVTLLGTDGQKLYEAVLYGSYIITAPVVFLSCVGSCIFVLSSGSVDALIIMSVFLLTYPLLVSFDSVTHLCFSWFFVLWITNQ